MQTWTTRGCRTVATICFGVLLLVSGGAEAADFYLSTDEIYRPGDDVSVNLESHGIGELDIRVYRLEDPVTYLRSLRDPHRPVVERGDRRPSAVVMFKEAYRRIASSAFDDFKERLKRKGRKVAREGFSRAVRHFENQSMTAEREAGVPPLRDYPLEARFSTDVSSDGGEWEMQPLHLPVTESGVYLVEAVSGSQGAHTLVVVSNIAMLTKQGPEEMVVFVASQDSGKPADGASVQIFSGSGEPTQAETDADGLARARVRSSRSFVVAQKADDVAIFDPRYFPAGLDDARAYIFTDRPVYRPGDEVFFKGFVRQRVADGYRVAGGSSATVECLDPKGGTVSSLKVPVKNGSFDGRCDTDSEAPIGRYKVVAEIGDEKFAGEFKVKAYKKPEYKVTVTTDKRAYRVGDRVKGKIKGAFFYGAPLPDAKLTYEVYRTRFYVPWWVDADFSWYYSDSEVRNTRRELITQGEGTLNSKGIYEFDFQTKDDSVDYTYVVEAYVTNDAGRAIPGRKSFRVTKGQFRLSLQTSRLVVGKDETIDVTVEAMDYAGDPIGGQKVSFLASSVVTGGDGGEVIQEAQTMEGTTNPKGVARFALKLNKLGYYRLEATSTDDAGAQVRAEHTAFVSEAGESMAFVPGQLEMVADRRIYRRGDTAKFLVLTPFAEGHVVMTVEGGDLYETKVVEIKGYSALFTTEIDKAQTPNFFVGAAAIYDGHVYELNRSVVVPPADQFLKVEVSSDKTEYEPRQKGTFKFKVTDHAGKPVKAELAVGIINEKVYSISPEVAVPIERFFYPKRRNNVRFGSSLNFRFYGYARNLKTESAHRFTPRPYGYGAPKNTESGQRESFVDTLHWEPTLQTNSQGEATLEVTFADNLTGWRVTARAMTRDTRVGMGTHTVRTRKDVIVSVAVPSVLRERDRAEVLVSGRNYTNKAQPLALSLEAKGGKLTGESSSPKVDPNGEGSVRYILEVNEPGEVELVATAAGSVKDSKVIRIPVLPYGVEDVVAVAGHIGEGEESQSQSAQLELPGSAAPNTAHVTVRVGTGMAAAVLSALDYLTEYPYGCVEQTTNKFLPNLVVARTLKDLGLRDRKLEQLLPGYISAGVGRLASFQQSDGGWGWFDQGSDAFMTSHVMYGLVQAKKLGYDIDSEVYRKGLKRLDMLSRNAAHNTRAYALYVLALASKPSVSMMGKLSEASQLTPYGQALVALALSEAGEKERAVEVVEQAEKLAVYDPDRDSTHWSTASTDTYDWTRDPIETTATMVRALLATRPDSPAIDQGMRWLLDQRQGNRWQSTRDTAAVVYATVDHFQRFRGTYPTTELEATFNGTAADAVSFGPDDIFAPEKVLFDGTPKAKKGANLLELTKGPGGRLYYTAAIQFFNVADELEARSGAFTVEREYLRLFPEGAGKFEIGADTDTLKLGQLALVKVSAKATKKQPFVWVEDPLPAGWEVVEADSGYEVGVKLHPRGVYREIRDDRVTFFQEELSGSQTYAYVIRAIRPGSYHAMPARVRVMYQPDLSGHSSGRRVEVKQ